MKTWSGLLEELVLGSMVEVSKDITMGDLALPECQQGIVVSINKLNDGTILDVTLSIQGLPLLVRASYGRIRKPTWVRNSEPSVAEMEGLQAAALGDRFSAPVIPPYTRTAQQ